MKINRVGSFVAGLALGISGLAAAQLLPYFGPVTGILKGQAGNPQTSVAAASDVVGLWSGCSSSEAYLGYLGSCITPSLFTSSAAGIVPASGGGTANFLRADGTWDNPSASPCTFAAPSASVGLSAVTGSTGDCMDAGSAPPLSQSIAPTWTAQHNWSTGSTPAIVLATNSGVPALKWGGTAIGALWSGSAAAEIGSTNDYPLCLFVDELACALEIQTGATDGTVQIVDSGGNLFNAGYLSCPYNVQSSAYTVALSDRDKCVRVSSTATISLPCDGTFGLGDTVSIVAGASVTVTLTASSGTLYWANGTTTSGNRTVTGVAIATVIFDGTSGATSVDCLVTGAGIS